jgi:hypothetical protein
MNVGDRWEIVRFDAVKKFPIVLFLSIRFAKSFHNRDSIKSAPNGIKPKPYPAAALVLFIAANIATTFQRASQET